MVEAVQPFLRWAGSKRWLTDQVATLAPESFGDYHEPFLGSGAIYFSLQPTKAFLSDALAPLIDCYREVKRSPTAVAAAASSWATDKETYYSIRRRVFDDPVTSAAKFIYLNKLCFNGLYRENQRGEFNVPYGRPNSSRVLFEKQLETTAIALQGATISHADFEESLDRTQAGDLVYLDPPYVAGHRTNGFVDYNAKIFSWEDQRRLALSFRRLSDLGVHVIMSNADHATVRELYRGFKMKSVARYSSMSAKSSLRGNSAELIIVSESVDIGEQ